MSFTPGSIVPKLSLTANGEYRVGNMLTRREFIEIERIRNSKYFLVHNDGSEMGGRAPCRWHKKDPFSPIFEPTDARVFHAYFSLMCAERPYVGLEGALRAWIEVAGDSERKQAIQRDFGIGLRDYSELHPHTAALLKPPSPDALAWYSYVIGVPEPITEEHARRLVEKIRDRRPPQFPHELRPLLVPKIITPR
jgi:hypothetical protein